MCGKTNDDQQLFAIQEIQHMQWKSDRVNKDTIEALRQIRFVSLTTDEANKK